MASQLNARQRTRIVIFLVAALLLIWASVDARAQGKYSSNSSSTSTTGNSSWEQAIAVLQAKVDQQAAAIAQLQAALATETTARQASDAALQNSVSNTAAASQAAHQTLQASINAETAA